MRKYNLNIISESVVPLDIRSKDLVKEVTSKSIRLKFVQKFHLRLVGVIGVILGIISIFAAGDDLFNQIWLVIIFFLLGAIFLLIAHFVPDKYWVLNRENQEISIPQVISNKIIEKSVFDVKSGYYIQTGGNSPTVPVVVPVVWHKSKLAFKNASSLTTWRDDDHKGSDTARTWSFYIWYLDKNRPLPPGELLDPFREEDFQRRKAEGFPPPLFCSCIVTPEATPEQQEEREKYWKDEDYMFRLDRYKEPKLWSGFTRAKTLLKLEKEATLISRGRNPDNWELKPYPEFDNFKYLPTAYAMRYEFEDGKIVYSMIDQKTELACTPPSHLSFKKEIIR